MASKSEALKRNGRLKKGYRYVKGGRIVKAGCKATRRGRVCSTRKARRR